MGISFSRITFRNHGLVGIVFYGVLGVFGHEDREVRECLIRDAMRWCACLRLSVGHGELAISVLPC